MAARPQEELPVQPRPQITSSNTCEYRHRLADISSRATFSDALNTLFQTERVGPSAQPKPSDLYDATLARIETKVALGSQIVEAGDFAAGVCWEPPGAVQPNHTEEELGELALERPLYAAFLRDIEAARTGCLGGQECWQLSLMARDPGRKSPGAVRAIIEPFVDSAREGKLPIWCVAGSERARDVYMYFGFRVVRVVYSGQDRVETWCMVCNWPTK